MVRKKKICKECSREDYIFSKGRCKFCASKTYKKPAQISSKKSKEKKERSKKLSPFFEYHTQEIAKKPICINCKQRITNPFYWSVAHILPKDRYKEVEDEEKNCVYMCVYPNNCHGTFDNIQNSQDVYNFPAWEEIHTKYLQFKEKVTTFGKEREILDNYDNIRSIKNSKNKI